MTTVALTEHQDIPCSVSYGSDAWAALIAQIRKDPRSVELRDVAADYLIEHDDPRGEFIVLRNRLAAGDVPPTEYVAVYDRHRELEREQPWQHQLGALPMRWSPPFTGFIDHASIEREGLVALDVLCRHEPLTRLYCSGLQKLSDDLLDTPELDEVNELELAEDSTALFASPRLGNVRTVRIWRGTQAYFEALAASRLRPHRLELGPAAHDHLVHLVRSPVLDQLRELPVATDEGVEALRDHALAHLAHLDATRLSRASVLRLASHLDQLVTLRIGEGADLMLPLIVDHVRSGNLRELALVIRESDVPAVVVLIDSAACLRLQKLTIRGLPLPLPIEQAIRKLAFHGHLVEVLVESRRGGRIQIPGAHVIEVS
jgi:uncharacterized protein (TIGR02996 family)